MSENRHSRGTILLFAATIFLSAFLLFQVQPLLGKFILPWFGGSPAVWTTCMLVFQVLLFAGYAYAHALNYFRSVKTQVAVHATLLCLACCLLPIVPSAEWKPGPADPPVLRIILLTLCTVGTPYFLLSSTGPLVQSWFGRTLPGASPYRLYSLSNLGSLLALLSYPFVFEPLLATPLQATLWSVGFALFAVLCISCGFLLWKTQNLTLPAALVRTNDASSRISKPAAPAADVVVLWFGLAMLPSAILLAITNQVCLDVAVIPFLWVVPLALYLLTFILVFDASGWYSRTWYSLSSAVLIGLTLFLVYRDPAGLVMQLCIYFATLFCCCMVCHGELVRLKPNPAYLTHYYLTISAGGAAGGLFVGLAAPLLFHGYYELQLSFVAYALLYFAVTSRERQTSTGINPQLIRGLSSTGILFLVGMLLTQMGSSENTLAVSRNFYGVLRVRQNGPETNPASQRLMVHGRVVHGSQFLSSEKKGLPTTYYGHESGIGQVLDKLPQNKPHKIGVIGLGIGSLANYAKPSDSMRFYEINPDVIRMAQQYFSCLSDCRGAVDVIPGDARLVLDFEQPQQFDVLVLDAFSGDAIPVHLLTKQAGEIYHKHLRHNGILACHISNLHFNLQPVLDGLATEFHWTYRKIRTAPNPQLGTEDATWILMSADASVLEQLLGPPASGQSDESVKSILWTDDRSNLLEVLR